MFILYFFLIVRLKICIEKNFCYILEGEILNYVNFKRKFIEFYRDVLIIYKRNVMIIIIENSFINNLYRF